jgi:hypothetical protein
MKVVKRISFYVDVSSSWLVILNSFKFEQLHGAKTASFQYEYLNIYLVLKYTPCPSTFKPRVYFAFNEIDKHYGMCSSHKPIGYKRHALENTAIRTDIQYIVRAPYS